MSRGVRVLPGQAWVICPLVLWGRALALQPHRDKLEADNLCLCQAPADGQATLQNKPPRLETQRKKKEVVAVWEMSALDFLSSPFLGEGPQAGQPGRPEPLQRWLLSAPSCAWAPVAGLGAAEATCGSVGVGASW